MNLRPVRHRKHILIGLSLACAATAALALLSTRNATQAESQAESQPESRTAASSLYAAASADADRDGLPDAMQLISHTDRENFRRWFTRIAEHQFYRASDEWNAGQRDCAGLVRFSLREALRRHDRLWLRRMGAEYEVIAPDISRYTLDRSPVGEKLFRTRAGEFTPANLDDNTFAEFADARTLKEFNSEFISRDRAQAQAGDLLFFRQPWGQRFPYHVMIFLGAAAENAGESAADSAAADWVVYHTGAIAGDAGAIAGASLMKKVRLAVLAQHPDPRWRPVAANPRFLGFYRLKILT